VVILYKNNYASLKIIDVGIFLFFFISLKYLFPFIFYLSGGHALVQKSEVNEYTADLLGHN